MSEREVKNAEKAEDSGPVLAPLLGSTGKYPHGRLNPDDEGELVIGIQADKRNKVVVMSFGDTKVSWIGMPAQQALDIAEALVRRAKELM